MTLVPCVRLKLVLKLSSFPGAINRREVIKSSDRECVSFSISSLVGTGAGQSSLYRLDSSQNILYGFLDDVNYIQLCHISYRQIVARLSLSFGIFHEKCSDRYQPLVSQA